MSRSHKAMCIFGAVVLCIGNEPDWRPALLTACIVWTVLAAKGDKP